MRKLLACTAINDWTITTTTTKRPRRTPTAVRETSKSRNLRSYRHLSCRCCCVSMWRVLALTSVSGELSTKRHSRETRNFAAPTTTTTALNLILLRYHTHTHKHSKPATVCESVCICSSSHFFFRSSSFAECTFRWCVKLRKSYTRTQRSWTQLRVGEWVPA